MPQRAAPDHAPHSARHAAALLLVHVESHGHARGKYARSSGIMMLPAPPATSASGCARARRTPLSAAVEEAHQAWGGASVEVEPETRAIRGRLQWGPRLGRGRRRGGRTVGGHIAGDGGRVRAPQAAEAGNGWEKGYGKGRDRVRWRQPPGGGGRALPRQVSGPHQLGDTKTYKIYSKSI
ncbi:hypothetical protein C8R44DRAFT_730458 [Mycena epipterygia]|nr:hypothetical protein C8R44DRAFT_730458 [Mycena epipterygia]